MHYCLWVHEVWFHNMPHPASGAGGGAQPSSWMLWGNTQCINASHNMGVFFLCDWLEWDIRMMVDNKTLKKKKCCFLSILLNLLKPLNTHMRKMNRCFLQWFYLLPLTWFYSNRAFVQHRYNITSGRHKQQLDWWAGARKHKAINLVYNSSPLFL